MSSLISNTEKEYLSGKLFDHWTTFARDIVIFKEPKRTITTINVAGVYPGYGQNSNIENVTYTPVSGIHQAMVIYHDKNQFGKEFFETRNTIQKGQVKIKLHESGHNFISDGKNEKFLVDGSTYNIISDFYVQNYLGLKFYYYLLERSA